MLAITHPNFEVRDYQVRIFNTAFEYIDSPDIDGLRSLLIESPCGCHAKGTQILMANGHTKSVEDIIVGDRLMGEFNPVTVTKLHRGKQEMVRIVPTKGDPFVVNLDHYLTLQWSITEGKIKTKNKNIDITVKNYLKLSNDHKNNLKLYRSPVAHFEGEIQESELPMDPYFLGVLIGDGSILHGIAVTTMDSEIVKLSYEQAKLFGVSIRVNSNNSKTKINKAKTYHFTIGEKFGGLKHHKNPIATKLKLLGLFGKRCEHKFIPNIYKTASIETRKQILAGLLDTDGSLGCGVFDFISKSKQLATDVCYIARSIGLAAYMKLCQKYCQTGGGGDYWRVSISGDTNIIPTRITRKQASLRKQIKSVLRVGFKINQLNKIDNYYGFEVDGNNRYLLGDFTLTHNSGKTIMGLSICKKLSERNLKCGWIAHRKELLNQAKRVNDEIFNVSNFQLISLFDRNPYQYKGIDVLVVDEATHDATTSASIIHEAIKPSIIIGLSATPYRADRAKLCFSKVIRDAGIHQLIRENWLAPYKLWMMDDVWTPLNVAKLYMESPTKWGQSVMYFTTIDDAEKCAEILKGNGVKAESIIGGMDREDVLLAFRNGELNVLTNVQVLTEGFDEPSLQTAFVRPSVKAPTIQMAGRAFRKNPNKQFANIVQNRETKFPFSRHATPMEQYIQKNGVWESLEIKNLSQLFEEQRTKILQANIELPKMLQEFNNKKNNPHRRAEGEFVVDEAGANVV